ncbi:hypothetical protein D3C85_1108760 [compost metagenome]
MQAQVDEIAGDVFAVRPFTCRVGDDQGRVVALEHADKQRIDKTVMTDFHGMAQGLLFVSLQTRMAGDVGVVLAGEGGGLFGIAGQLVEEVFEQLDVEFEAGRKLPEDRPEFFFQLQHSGRKKIRQRLVDVPQPLDMGNEARGLDAEDEVERGFAIPLGITFGPLQRVERSIDFDAVDRPRGELQFAPLGQAPGVEVSPPGRIAPA